MCVCFNAESKKKKSMILCWSWRNRSTCCYDCEGGKSACGFLKGEEDDE